MKMTYIINGTEIILDGSPQEMIEMIESLNLRQTNKIFTPPAEPAKHIVTTPKTPIVATNTIKSNKIKPATNTTNDFVQHLYRYAPASNHPLAKGAIIAQHLVNNVGNELSFASIVKETGTTEKLVRRVIARMISANAIVTTSTKNVNGNINNFVIVNSIPKPPYSKSVHGAPQYTKDGKPTSGTKATVKVTKAIPASLAQISLSNS